MRLRNHANAVLLEAEYDDDVPWPASADGAGHSLSLARPDYGERSWKASSDANRWTRSSASRWVAVNSGSPPLPCARSISTCMRE